MAAKAKTSFSLTKLFLLITGLAAATLLVFAGLFLLSILDDPYEEKVENAYFESQLTALPQVSVKSKWDWEGMTIWTLDVAGKGHLKVEAHKSFPNNAVAVSIQEIGDLALHGFCDMQRENQSVSQPTFGKPESLFAKKAGFTFTSLTDVVDNYDAIYAELKTWPQSNSPEFSEQRWTIFGKLTCYSTAFPRQR